MATESNDGQTITINGMQYAQGLGTNSISDVKLYLGGNCSNFTSTVGMDDEVGNSGTVTFTVIGDGKTLAATQTIKGGDPDAADHRERNRRAGARSYRRRRR